MVMINNNKNSAAPMHKILNKGMFEMPDAEKEIKYMNINTVLKIAVLSKLYLMKLKAHPRPAKRRTSAL